MERFGNQGKVALLYFVFAALLGTVLRWIPVTVLPFNYRYLVHAHSHIALLGWVYLAMAALYYATYLKPDRQQRGYRTLYIAAQIALVGMLLTFPFQGYALASIIFSTLFLFVTYGFAWMFHRGVSAPDRNRPSVQCMRAALGYLVVSSIGPWALGAIMGTVGSDSVWYRLAIYFYLHFLYNGWMIMALLGVFFFIVERQGPIPGRLFRPLFILMNVSVVLTFFLSTLFADPPFWAYLLGGLGSLFQLIVFAALVIGLQGRGWWPQFTRGQAALLRAVVILWGIKMVLQLASAVPWIANWADKVLDLIVGYLHLTFLGVVTLALFAFLDYFGILRLSRLAMLLYAIGFIGTEGLIFYRGFALVFTWPIPKDTVIYLALASSIIVLALLVALWGYHTKKTLPKS